MLGVADLEHDTAAALFDGGGRAALVTRPMGERAQSGIASHVPSLRLWCPSGSLRAETPTQNCRMVNTRQSAVR
jgi:hypothetical protein